MKQVHDVPDVWKLEKGMRQLLDSYVKVFYLDYGLGDEDDMADQIFVKLKNL